MKRIVEEKKKNKRIRTGDEERKARGVTGWPSYPHG